MGTAREGWGFTLWQSYFLATESFGGGAALGLDTKRFASGLRVLQSTGGKETRQKRVLGCANSTPTSASPFAPGLESTTLQGTSAPVTTFLIFKAWPSRTGSCNYSSVPCAFTISALVCSTNGVPLARLPETRNGTDNRILGLRR